MEELKPIAREALDAFDAIASSAGAGLASRGVTLDSFAQVNEATAERLAANLRERDDDRTANLAQLRHKPAIARLVIEDEDKKLETLYISPAGGLAAGNVRLCSYMSPKGRLASFGVGGGDDIPLPGGSRWFTVREKMTFAPLDDVAGWDSRPAVHFRKRKAPLTIKSLRELLRDDGLTAEQADAVIDWLNDGDAQDGGGNISEGIKRDVLTAMQLRIAPILDPIQDRVYRLPLDSQIALLGPPGTGKTTTMVRRLRQKLDPNYLEPEERDLVEGRDAAGLDHATSWIVFTPTELLRLYVTDALSKEGVPAHGERLHTWDDYRRKVARDELGILRRGNGGGLVMPQVPDDTWLTHEALGDQIAWFEAFDTWQAEGFVAQLSVEAAHLRNAEDAAASLLGRRIGEAIERSGANILQLLGELAGLRDDLASLAGSLGEAIKGALTKPLSEFAKADPEFLDALSAAVTEMLREAPDESDEEEEDEQDEDDAVPQPIAGRRLVADIFRRAMRTLAIGQASRRSPAAASRAGRIIAFINERGFAPPDLKDTGRTLLLQRAAGRLAGAPANFIRRLPVRYRQFRRAMRSEGKWYPENAGAASRAHPAEIDLIMLGMLRAAAAFEGDRLLAARFADRRPAILDSVARLRRNQVLVDEMTDFSPVQLACMAALASPTTRSLFLSGDFNQRLTLWGSRSEEDLKWVAPGLDTQRISITYRQSRKLAEFARRLAALQGADVDDQAPDFSENIGFDPVLGCSLQTDADRARWLTDRIREIENATNGQLPTIAILVPDKRMLAGLTDALNVAFADLSLQAKAYSEGEAIGKTNDVRIFPVEHIKGLEFEAVFFVDVDRLANEKPELFGRFVYVGATRAATFLGLTCGSQRLPRELDHPDLTYGTHW